MIPLIVYVLDFIRPLHTNLFLTASQLTGVAFIIVGWLKASVNHTHILRGILETLLLGVIAAGVAYYVGDFIEAIVNA